MSAIDRDLIAQTSRGKIKVTSARLNVSHRLTMYVLVWGCLVAGLVSNRELLVLRCRLYLSELGRQTRHSQP